VCCVFVFILRQETAYGGGRGDGRSAVCFVEEGGWGEGERKGGEEGGGGRVGGRGRGREGVTGKGDLNNDSSRYTDSLVMYTCLTNVWRHCNWCSPILGLWCSTLLHI